MNFRREFPSSWGSLFSGCKICYIQAWARCLYIYMPINKFSRCTGKHSKQFIDVLLKIYELPSASVNYWCCSTFSAHCKGVNGPQRLHLSNVQRVNSSRERKHPLGELYLQLPINSSVRAFHILKEWGPLPYPVLPLSGP